MPPRRKPTSTKQKKADQQLKRAIKRGDVSPEPKKKNHKPKKMRIGPTGQLIGSDPKAVESSRRLQSSFIKMSAEFLEESKTLASTLILPRPIPVEFSVYHDFSSHREDPESLPLSCPRRPKWRFEMTKIEVEHNEEGVFKKWLSQTDEILAKWQSTDVQHTDHQESSMAPSSVTSFERNLEVWRQLWRVTEISQIILVLVDSRCPLLHYPPSLSAYLADRPVIIVLTKVDIVTPAQVEAWRLYFHENYPKLPVVPVESYIRKESGVGHQGKLQYEPHIPESFRERLVMAIKEIHTRMLQPPEIFQKNTALLAKWTAPVKRKVDWEALLKAGGTKLGSVVVGASVSSAESSGETASNDDAIEPELLTIGVIGQPNVGKSSLLNALFGTKRVRASKTPGKTKHFQTLYWTSDVRLVDCPGLVMPSYTPMEMQVLSGILPISRVSAVPACIYFASRLLPLERIFNLSHPATKQLPVEDKRTWREGVKTENKAVKENPPKWTAMDILTAYADLKGWVTAKAGRPDVHRAGNAILRSLAEGKIAWSFWPPYTNANVLGSEEGLGIWIPRNADEEQSEYEASSEEGSHASGEENKNEDDTEEDDVTEDEESDDHVVENVGVGRFGALIIQGENGSGGEE